MALSTLAVAKALKSPNKITPSTEDEKENNVVDAALYVSLAADLTQDNDTAVEISPPALARFNSVTGKRTFDERLAELSAFRSIHGHCRVPHRYPSSPGLARWVLYMRTLRQESRLSGERLERLNAIGFCWADRQHASWQDRFDELRRYRDLHGTTRVGNDHPLGRWVSVQRTNYRKNNKRHLSQERIDQLDSIGFVWNAEQDDWEQRFQELLAYRIEHGHCSVPQHWPGAKKLANFVRVQRTNFRQGRLSQSRIDLLNSIGFSWGRTPIPSLMPQSKSLPSREELDIAAALAGHLMK